LQNAQGEKKGEVKERSGRREEKGGRGKNSDNKVGNNELQKVEGKKK